MLHHQKDIERMDSFREQMGEDWLRFQHHLDGTPATTTGLRVENDAVPVSDSKCCTPSPPAPKSSLFSPGLESLPAPLLSSEPKREEEEIEPDTESTLQWTGHSPPNTESTIEMSIEDSQVSGEASADPAHPEEEEEDLGGLSDTVEVLYFQNTCLSTATLHQKCCKGLIRYI